MRSNDRFRPRSRRIRPLPPRVLKPLGLEPPTRIRSLDETGQRRVEAFCPLAYQLAWKFARHAARDVPAEELIAEALLGLTYAAGLFDETRGVPFGAYATLVVRHRLIQAIIRWRRARRVRPLPVGRREGDPWESADPSRLPEVPAQSAAREMCDQLRRLLPDRWYSILLLYHVEGCTLGEVGQRLGISRERVRQLIEKATEQARESFPTWTRA
jgi:RNA polymerase sigma factor (sigma-70 family)